MHVESTKGGSMNNVVRKAFSPEMTTIEIIELLGDRDPGAISILTEIAHDHPTEFRFTAFDLDDMRMRGYQIVVAYREWAEQNMAAFLQGVAGRDAEMVGVVNAQCAPRVARAMGDVKTLPAVDGAVRQILQEAAQNKKLERVDEGADVVHEFFLSLLTRMQQERSFVSNFRLNLAAEGLWAVFAIQLVDIVNREGESINAKPKGRTATPAEINAAFEKERARLKRPMTFEEVQALDAELSRVIERDGETHGH